MQAQVFKAKQGIVDVCQVLVTFAACVEMYDSVVVIVDDVLIALMSVHNW